MQLTRSRMTSTDKHKLRGPSHCGSHPSEVCCSSYYMRLCHRRLLPQKTTIGNAQKLMTMCRRPHRADLHIDAVLHA